MGTGNSQCARQSLVLVSNIEPTMVMPGENFQNGGSQKARKCYSRMVVANTVNVSFNYTLFQLLYKYYVALTLQKLPDPGDVIAEFYRNFPKYGYMK